MTKCLFIIIIQLTLLISCDSQEKLKLFQLLDSKSSGIEFSNQLTPSDSMNILDFEYMFNGGGVAVGDINNDGLQDIYFSGNQVSSRLYLNKGDLKFEDITNSAKVGTTGWSNGVAMVDINQDGFLDIYVSRGGPRYFSQDEMSNLLFINNGDGTFKESANGLGIDDTGYSIQAIFFDYDKDGDTDLYVLTNALVDYNRNTSRKKALNGEATSTDRLYRNDGSQGFTNVSKDAGILVEGFGLGVSICDINKDNWPDIYVSNDFLTNDLLYINNQNGTFTDKIENYLKHQSYNGMGNDIADIDNDGNMDIMVTDMFPNSNERIKQSKMKVSYDTYSRDISLGYSPQTVRNTLQLNNGNGTFSEIGQLTGMHNTDWSWAPLMADFDNDGKKDVFITNGYRRDITNLDYIVYGKQSSYFGRSESRDSINLSLLQNLPEVKLQNFIFKNNGNLTFENKVNDWGLSHYTYSNGAAYADLDNDGDLELIISNIDDKAILYKNNSMELATINNRPKNYLDIELKDKNAVGTKVTVFTGNQIQVQMFSPIRGYLSTVTDRIHFGLGNDVKVDSIHVAWSDGNLEVIKDVRSNQVLGVFRKNLTRSIEEKAGEPEHIFDLVGSEKGIEYRHQEDDFIELRYQASLLKMNTKLGPGIAVGDVNNDGLEDFYVGGTVQKNGRLFVQDSKGNFQARSILEGIREDMAVLLVDVDCDSDLDLISIDGGGIADMIRKSYSDLIFVNDGKGNFEPTELLQREGRGACAEMVDFDKDGDLDLFIGGKVINGSYPNSPNSYLLLNENGKFIDHTFKIFGSNGNLGMVSDALWTDFNNDGNVDLIVVGEFMEVRFYKNIDGKLVDVTQDTGLQNMNGWWNSIVSGDFDQDGDMDYVVGNLGQNSDVKASPEEPVTIYAKDFDGNGSIDPLLTCFRNGKEHLIHPRDVVIAQISSYRNRFLDYESYANATMDKTFTENELKEAFIVKATNFSSTYIENLGNGKFKNSPLPLQSQFAPVYGVQVQDYNSDGFLDLLIVGNHYSVEPSTGPYDASIGTLLLGDGNGSFSFVRPSKSGINTTGDAKGTATMITAGQSMLTLIGQNSGKLLAYSSLTSQQQIKVKPLELSAMVHLRNGKVVKYEFPYGNSYLSQSSRFLTVDKEATDFVEFFTATGEKRKQAF